MSLKDDLKKHVSMERLSLHMPGHKGLRDPQDVTELPGLDNLLHPTGSLLELEARMAAHYEAAQAYLGTGGSTSMILSAMLQAGRGERIVLPRVSHQSVYKGMMANLQEPVYLPNKLNNLGIAAPIEAEDYVKHLAERTLVFNGPTYEGFFEDYAPIEPMLWGKLTILDGAHGAHLRFLGIRANSWMKLIIHSLHKTLGVLNSGAVLLSNLEDGVREAAGFFQTTSPSYPVLLSMEESLDQLEGMDPLAVLEDLSVLFEEIDCIRGFRPLQASDPLKLLLQGDLRFSMLEIAVWLREEWGIFFEIEEERYLLGMLTLYRRKDQNQYLLKALDAASLHFGMEDDFLEPASAGRVHLPVMKHLPGEAFGAPRLLVPVRESIGRVSSVLYSPYPPGAPLLVPGEVIDETVVEAILRNKKDFTGCSELKDERIYVLK